MKGLTIRQKEILDFIRNYLSQNHYSPTFKEIGSYFGFSSLGSVYNHIKVLKRKGLLISEPFCARSLNFIKPSSSSGDLIELPMIGYLKSGMPIETLTNPTLLKIPYFYIDNPENHYLLQVKGNSLLEEAMLDGDIVIIEAKTEANLGDLVIALVNEQETLIKRYFPEIPYIRLESSNPQVNAMVLREHHVKIQGIIQGVIRLFYSS